MAHNKVWDFDKMLSEYGMDFLAENYHDEVPINMAYLHLYIKDPLEAIRKAFYGGRYSDKTNSKFNPNDEYFYFDGYANIVSLPEDDLDFYLENHINETAFIDWCESNSLID